MQKILHRLLTKKQQEILYLLYRYRFLSTRHIQKSLNHKNPTRIQTWLKQLTISGFIHCFYDQSTLLGKATPAVYCLTTKAGHILKKSNEFDERLLKELYKEKKRSERFRNHCLFLADIYFLLTDQCERANERMHFSTKVDLIEYKHFPHPLPDAYVAFMKKGKKRRRYFVDIIDPSIPWFVINARVQRYLTYYEEGTWHENAYGKEPFILFICWEQRSIRYLKKAVKKALEGTFYNDFPCFFITRETLLKHGFTRDSLQKAAASENY